MAIRIELSELRRISGRTTSINDELARDLSDMVSNLDEICNILQTKALIAANENLKNAIKNLANDLKYGLPQIQTFLDNQVDAYTESNEIAKAAIGNLVSSLNSNFGGASTPKNSVAYTSNIDMLS